MFTKLKFRLRPSTFPEAVNQRLQEIDLQVEKLLREKMELLRIKNREV